MSSNSPLTRDVPASRRPAALTAGIATGTVAAADASASNEDESSATTIVIDNTAASLAPGEMAPIVVTTTAASPDPSPPAATDADAAGHAIVEGDTLWDLIKAHYGHVDADQVARVAAYLGIDDPNNIPIGTRIVFPSEADLAADDASTAAEAPSPVAAPSTVVYIAVKGDSLWTIIERHNGHVDATAVKQVAAASGIDDPNLIFPGQRVVLPGSVSVTDPDVSVDEQAISAADPAEPASAPVEVPVPGTQNEPTAPDEATPVTPTGETADNRCAARSDKPDACCTRRGDVANNAIVDAPGINAGPRRCGARGGPGRRRGAVRLLGPFRVVGRDRRVAADGGDLDHGAPAAWPADATDRTGRTAGDPTGDGCRHGAGDRRDPPEGTDRHAAGPVAHRHPARPRATRTPAGARRRVRRRSRRGSVRRPRPVPASGLDDR